MFASFLQEASYFDAAFVPMTECPFAWRPEEAGQYLGQSRPWWPFSHADTPERNEKDPPVAQNKKRDILSRRLFDNQQWAHEAG